MYKMDENVIAVLFVYLFFFVGTAVLLVVKPQKCTKKGRQGFFVKGEKAITRADKAVLSTHSKH